MKKVLILKKKEGETPLECLERFRASHKQYKDIKMTYAGRLDPMAEGLLLVLAGDEVKNKEKYLKLDKVYEFEVLFSFATDTYDILGKITHGLIRANSTIEKKELERKIKQNLKHFTGKFIQKYPLYSSKTIKKARAGMEVERAEREVVVKNIKLLKIKTITSKKLIENINQRIKKVKGDFRQKEIIKIWHRNLFKNKNNFFIAGFRVECSSGTYVRGIANGLGGRMHVPALAFSIKRTKIGKWSKI